LGFCFPKPTGFAMTEIVSEPQEQKASQAASQHSVQDSQPGSRSRRGGRGRQNLRQAAPQAARPQHPLLEQLAQWHPALFGEQLLPFKRGIFEDLLAAHPSWTRTAQERAAAAHPLRSLSGRHGQRPAAPP
jgi:hypothetical protein